MEKGRFDAGFNQKPTARKAKTSEKSSASFRALALPKRESVKNRLPFYGRHLPFTWLPVWAWLKITLKTRILHFETPYPI